MDQINKTGMSELWDSSTFYGESAAWLESMYETYLTHPDKLETKWRLYFDGISSPNPQKRTGSNGNGHGNGVGGNGSAAVNVRREVSPREMHDYFVNYALQKHTRGFEAQTGFDHERKQVQVLQLINAYRFRGHQVANLNPLDGRREAGLAELTLGYHELSENDYDTVFETGSLATAEHLPLREIHQVLQQVLPLTSCLHLIHPLLK